MVIQGKCHCGNIAIALRWEPDPVEIPARACSCTFCVKHGGVWTADRRAALTVLVRNRALESQYEFGTKTAQFHVCRECGVVPLASCRIEGRLYAVVNVNTFENVVPALLARSVASFDGEGTDSRLARRARNWIGSVAFEYP
jgi:hypothetical protein